MATSISEVASVIRPWRRRDSPRTDVANGRSRPSCSFPGSRLGSTSRARVSTGSQTPVQAASDLASRRAASNASARDESFTSTTGLPLSGWFVWLAHEDRTEARAQPGTLERGGTSCRHGSAAGMSARGCNATDRSRVQSVEADSFGSRTAAVRSPRLVRDRFEQLGLLVMVEIDATQLVLLGEDHAGGFLEQGGEVGCVFEGLVHLVT